MAGVESMIVEEKQPPPKQIDREKVSASFHLMASDINYESVYVNFLFFSFSRFNYVESLDLSIAVTCFLFHRASSFASRIQPWQFTIEWTTNLHMAGRNVTWIDRSGAWGKSRDETQRHLLWFCSGCTGSIWSRLSFAWNRCHLFGPMECRRFAIISTG